MAEDLEDDVDEGGPRAGKSGGGGKRRGGKKMVVLAIVALLLAIVGGGAGLYFSGIIDLGGQKSGDQHAGASSGATEGGQNSGAVPVAVFYDLPEMLVNLNSTGRKQSYLKIRVSLELQDALDVSRVETVMPRVADKFQVYLRELRPEDLQGSAGILHLREELLVRVNAIVSPAKVNDVLFKEMLVQ
ncbi:flagellar basal body protein FliL [Alphaproteobacteria bacterium]|nr:flagellar basal body protein FliL [Alphaproteobacteria bacterium]